MILCCIPALLSAQGQRLARLSAREKSETPALPANPESDNETATPEAKTMLNIRHTPIAYDSLVADWKFKYLDESQDTFLEEYIDLDTTRYLQAIGIVPDAEYRRRLDNLVSPIHLPYNEVIRKYILAYTTTHKGITRRMLGESKYYFPMIERELERQGLPLELKFLTVVESALNPAAVSRMGATGLWQFMLTTGRHYGLEVSSMIDQRRSPEEATRAACAYLKELYRIYGDWTLAIASYNCGPGNVNKALQRAGGNAKTYWDIYEYLPRETRNYIPAFVAVNYAYNYAQQHNIQGNTPSVPLVTDTITIRRNLHLEQVSSSLGVPLELLRMLNPQYKMDIIPASGRSYPLTLPQQEVCRFIANETDIYGRDSIYLKKYMTPTGALSETKIAAASPTGSATGKIYKVKSGDTLGAIGRKYGVTVTQLMKWNKLASASKLRIGQSLRVSP